MTQKNKVKELVGQSLNAYNTRVNNQMNRITSENKRQNHMINVLNTELVKDYLTKTEEASVMSLDHSKEGMVFIDGLEGNTLVNYCTDGSKELTLNGDIDLEGTFVTTTEGVDNGKVDVICEGNTMVNLCGCGFKELDNYTQLSGAYLEDRSFVRFQMDTNDKRAFRRIEYTPLKIATKYTVFVEIKENTIINTGENHILYPISNTSDSAFKDIWGLSSTDAKIGIHKSIVTTKDSFDGCTIGVRSYVRYIQGGSGYISYRLWILEGDWTNKEIPPYFEGMKSVGEGVDKFELTCNNKNLLKPTKTRYPYFIKKGTRLVLSEKNNTPSLGGNVMLIDKNGNTQWFAIDGGYTQPRYITTNNDIYYIENALNLNSELEYQVEMGTERTTYVPHTSNKVQITLPQPLRGLPNGVKDRFVKMSGKWYIERNCGEVIWNGSENWLTQIDTDWNTETHISFRYLDNRFAYNQWGSSNKIKYVSDRFKPIILTNDSYIKSEEFFGSNGTVSSMYINIKILKSRLSTQDADGLKQWLQANPTKVVYQLETQTYEPITDPVLTVYLDTAHISNNSIIPCNMKVKNSGYNAIIKPNTLYTVALDTNKSGTIGLNLGGGKIFTSNNVATITTPTTLTDDSLRIYGKGVKGSKVRLLEGDKTNWIPSMFEGMKSCFEDKDNVVELTSTNKNLFDVIFRHIIENNPNIDVKFNNGKLIVNGSFQHHYMFDVVIPKGVYRTTSTDDRLFLHVFWQGGDAGFANNGTITYHKDTNVTCYLSRGEYINYECSFQIEKGNSSTEFTPSLYNKIQYLLQEPLRGVGNVKDRFVFIDDKVMVERNCCEVVLNGSENGTWCVDSYCDKQIHTTSYRIRHDGTTRNGMILSDILQVRSVWNWDIEGIETLENDNIDIRIFKHRLKTQDIKGFNEWLYNNNVTIVHRLKTPTYEEVPTELADLVLECYENGTLFIDTIIPPTVSVRYSGETPMNKVLNKTKPFVEMNTIDLNENIVPYLMDMDYRVVMLQLQTGQTIAQYKSLGNIFTMLQRDIKSQRYSNSEYQNRIDAYHLVGKLSDEEFIKLGEMIND